MGGRKTKIAPETWVATARRALIEEGIAGVKVDRLACRLGVTRGGFFHHFGDREALFDSLIAHWEEGCQFLPAHAPGPTPADAALWIDHLTLRLIDEDGYDHKFDMAVREWSRSDHRAARAVERADRYRIAVLEQFFDALGYNAEEKSIRFYFHQIGYYALDVRESATERRRHAHVYLDILCGADRLEAARKAALTQASAVA
jgi:AcrR family transcriptional regulator